MAVLRDAELCLYIVLHHEGLIIFGKSLVEPRRHAGLSDIRVHNKVNVFMKDRSERVRVVAAGRESYVIDVVARLKITCYEIVRFSVAAFRLERAIRSVALEDDYVRRDRRAKVRAGEHHAERLAKLFQLCGDANYLFFRGVADKIKVPGSDVEPFIFDRSGSEQIGGKREH